jgi:hypothetical protein
MYFTHWINLHLKEPERPTMRITDTHGRWIFVLLSRVEDNVTADDMSLLRNLARACLALLNRHLRRRLGVEGTTIEEAVSMSKNTCWMVLTAIVGIWGQRDLWMEAESMLSGLD